MELDCSVQYARDYPVLWMKLDKDTGQHHLIISSGSTLIIRDSRFSLRYDPSSSLYTLQVKDLQETDAGTVSQCLWPCICTIKPFWFNLSAVPVSNSHWGQQQGKVSIGLFIRWFVWFTGNKFWLNACVLLTGYCKRGCFSENTAGNLG